MSRLRTPCSRMAAQNARSRSGLVRKLSSTMKTLGTSIPAISSTTSGMGLGP
jgi:hypothetical protein